MKFIQKILDFDMFVTTDSDYASLEATSIFDKLEYQLKKVGREEFLKMSLSNEGLQYTHTYEYCGSPDSLFQDLENSKKKRNVGDAFKHIVTDNWKVNMIVTMNLRALKNYLTLRDSGAAYFLMRELAIAIKDATPQKYLDLIVKDK